MQKYLTTILCLFLCALGGSLVCARAADAAERSSSSGTNAFNPHMNSTLPNLRPSSPDNQEMLKQLGGKTHRIEGEVAHRRYWREELYPVVFGDANAPHEILVLLDFAAPQSEKVWQAVMDASRSLSPAQTKIVAFANSKENYGTDLMGFAIWLSYSRNGESMRWLKHSLERWNTVKAEQRRTRGKAIPFNSEYDATVQPNEYPILYSYMATLYPPIFPAEEQALSKYCYEAGNVNMFQTTQVSEYYKVKSLPAVIVDGKLLPIPSAEAIVQASK